MIVCDTGPLVAAALSNDSDHKACVELFTAIMRPGANCWYQRPLSPRSATS